MQDTSVAIDETLRALDDLVTQGKVRYIGCSNYTGYRLVESLWTADKVRTHRYESVQLQWSLAVRGAEREVIPACRAFGLGTLVWSPLARGFLSGKYRRNQAPPQGTRLESWRTRSRPTTTTACGMSSTCWARSRSGARRRTPSAALAWLLAKPETTTILVGARSVQQLEDNLRATEVKLSAEDIKELDDASTPSWEYPYDFIGRQQPW